MVKTSGVIDEDFGEREINGLYNLSMMTQVDEITNERHLQMFKLEFHEAVCRVADKLCISSPYDVIYINIYIYIYRMQHIRRSN